MDFEEEERKIFEQLDIVLDDDFGQIKIRRKVVPIELFYGLQKLYEEEKKLLARAEAKLLEYESRRTRNDLS